MFGKSRQRRKSRARAASELLQDLPLALVRASTLDEVVRLTAQHVMRSLNYQDCVVYLQAADGKYEQVAVVGHESPGGKLPDNPMRLDPGEGIVGEAALSQRTQVVPDTSRDNRYIPDLPGQRSELSVPIVYRGKSIGVIDSEHEDTSFYGKDDAEIVTAIAAIAAGMIWSMMTTSALNESISSLTSAQVELEVAAHTDSLTGVANRRRLNQVVNAIATKGESFAMAVIDINDLKRVNDRYGNDRGDDTLRSVADTLSTHFSGDMFTLARCESDEFVVVAHPLPKDFAMRVTAALEDIRSLTVPNAETNFEISACGSIAFGTDETVWPNANDALILAKLSGERQPVTYRSDDPVVIQMRSDRTGGQRIERALATDSLGLVAQAVVDVSSNQVLFHEVLLRCIDEDGSWTSPIDLLQAAERLGLERAVDRWVTGKVIDTLRVIGADRCLAMNWSIASMMSSDMVTALITALKENDIAPSRVIVEVTEHGFIDSPPALRTAVEQLRSAGIRVALDDMGSGWSSLRTLRNTAVDFIKLDGEWVRQATDDELAFIATRSMIECARAVETQVIGEWVEDEPTLSLLTDLGATLMQGWLLHRPEPLGDVFPETATSRARPRTGSAAPRS